MSVIDPRTLLLLEAIALRDYADRRHPAGESPTDRCYTCRVTVGDDLCCPERRVLLHDAATIEEDSR